MERFWSKTKRNEETGCLEWTAALKKPSARDFRTGGQSLQHGQFHYEGRTELAHRVSVALTTGIPVRELPYISHSCDNPKCVEPLHLEMSSASQNLQEAWDRGRRKPNLEQNLIDLCAFLEHAGQHIETNQPDTEPTTCSTSAT
jgi:hypothetical protein